MGTPRQNLAGKSQEAVTWLIVLSLLLFALVGLSFLAGTITLQWLAPHWAEPGCAFLVGLLELALPTSAGTWLVLRGATRKR